MRPAIVIWTYWIETINIEPGAVMLEPVYL